MSQTSRRSLLVAAGALAPGLAACASAQAQSATQGPALVVRPQRVFKATDLPREGTQAWFVMIGAAGAADGSSAISRVVVDYLSSGEAVARSEYWGASLAGMTRALQAPAGPFHQFATRVISRQPASANVDAMRVTVTFAESVASSIDIPIGTYEQRTDLIFPFRGNGIVTQAGAANGGHRNMSGQFAIDAMGLSESYAVQTSAAFARNTDLAGFGRELIAPGAGVIVATRGDRPDQPVPGESNEEYHVPEHRGAGDPGNHVVIDHGNGEFSLVAHLQAGSLAVRAGDRVAQGQRLGALGNSGDSFAPHVHHQLQDGPNWQTDNGLPQAYRNVSSQRLDRGEFFTAA